MKKPLQHSGKKHCRLYRWNAGDCGMLTCSRCGKSAYVRLQIRIMTAAHQHANILFVTFYYDPRWMRDLSHLPMFKDHKKEVEQKFRGLMGKVFRALRDKARRAGCAFEYVIVFALGKVNHKRHKVLHSHALLTFIPDLKPVENSKRKERVQSAWLDKKLKRLHLVAWVELPRSVTAVARYTSQNAKTVIGKKDYTGVRVFRMSEYWEKRSE